MQKVTSDHIDNSLDWKKQIQETSKKFSRSIGMLKYAKRHLPFHALRTLYTSVIEPYFCVGRGVWRDRNPAATEASKSGCQDHCRQQF